VHEEVKTVICNKLKNCRVSVIDARAIFKQL
jgi:hypothetical protein